MAERVTELDLETRWDPSAPEAVLIAEDFGRTVLALRPHFDDPVQDCVVLAWSGTHSATMGGPNDEALNGHPLYDVGLSEVMWMGVVHDSTLIAALEAQNSVHECHDPEAYESLVHYVVLLKEVVVEVVARDLAVRRHGGSTLAAGAEAMQLLVSDSLQEER